MTTELSDAILVDPKDAAEQVGLVYVTDAEPGIRRRKNGRGFRYIGPDDCIIRDEATLARISKLAVPPAYTDVWICRRPNRHIQATGRDARGRKQYRYHERFRAVREGTKYEHMMGFARALPSLRATIASHMKLRGLPREKVIATVVHLLDTTLIRVGNDDYAKQNKSYGLTTLENRHVNVSGAELRFTFKGKSSKSWRLQMRDRRVANIVRACQELAGQELFQYIDEDGQTRDVTSSDVNAYLKEITGRDVTAKDFWTWAGTVLAALALQEFERFDRAAAAERNVKTAIEQVAARLANTPAICRKCYVHPEVFSACAEGALFLQIEQEIEQRLREDLAQLKPEEAAVLSLLEARLARTLQGDLAQSIALARAAKRQRRPSRAHCRTAA